MNAVRFLVRWWVALALLVALAMLGAAHWFETVGGLAPCHLCLKQREIYWFAVAIALPATLWAVFFRSRGTPRLAAFLLFAVFAAGTIVATFHAGVELKWWPGPETCSGGGGRVDLSDLQALINGTAKIKPPLCDVVAWKWQGVSMAGWNAVISAALALVSLVASMRRKDARRPG